MLAGCVGDIHYPVYKDLLFKSLNKIKTKPDVLLLAGDIVDLGHQDKYPEVVRIIKKKINRPLIAVFGNTEFRKKGLIQTKEVRFLDDEVFTFDNISVVGTRGSLDRPTSWQARNIPNIMQKYKDRVKEIGTLLANLETDVKILLMHYSPTYRTLLGEDERSYPWLGCRKMEEVIIKTKPNLVIHAHAHKGTKFVEIDGVPVYNVSLPLRKEITLIKI